MKQSLPFDARPRRPAPAGTNLAPLAKQMFPVCASSRQPPAPSQQMPKKGPMPVPAIEQRLPVRGGPGPVVWARLREWVAGRLHAGNDRVRVGQTPPGPRLPPGCEEKLGGVLGGSVGGVDVVRPIRGEVALAQMKAELE